MRISELAERAGVPVSTVRFYERIGLLPAPARTASGYRAYDEASAARLVFISRARRLGLSCEQIAEVLPIWDGVNCSATHEEVSTLIDEKRAEVEARIAELQRFAEQLADVRTSLLASPPPAACLPDLSCCMPESRADERAVSVALTAKRASAGEPRDERLAPVHD